MSGGLASFHQSDFGEVQAMYMSSKGFGEREEEKHAEKETCLGRIEEVGKCGEEEFLWSDFGCYQSCEAEERFAKHQQEEEESLVYSGFGNLDAFNFDVLSPPIQLCQKEILKLNEVQTQTMISEFTGTRTERPRSDPFASLGLLTHFGGGFKRMNSNKASISNNHDNLTSLRSQELSSVKIMRMAGARFIPSSSQCVDLSMIRHPYGSSFSGLTREETRDLELVQCLLASAQKVDHKQYDRALKLLGQCNYLSSNTGNPVQRVVSYFSEALWEKIEQETGRTTYKRPRKQHHSFHLEEAIIKLTPLSLIFQQIPFCQVAHFAGIQAIVESTTSAKKVHIIDLGIRSGVQWIILMQAFAAQCESPLKLLKITAIATTSRQKVEDTGKWLASYAENFRIPFLFQVVMLPDVGDQKGSLFNCDSEELIAVYSNVYLSSLIAQPDSMESLMEVIKNLHPHIMVVNEVEANNNSPSFLNRFIEALFFYNALFDMIEAFMRPDDANRRAIEELYCGEAIRNIIGKEGKERTLRHVKVDSWRAYFSQFGILERDLSMSSLYQAQLMAQTFPCGTFCTLEMNGKSLLIGWKGIPIFSLTAWMKSCENYCLNFQFEMENWKSCFDQIDLGEIQDVCSSSKGFEIMEAGQKSKQTHVNDTENWGEAVEIDSLWPEFGYFQDCAAVEEIMLSKYEQQLLSASVELLKNFQSGFRGLNGRKFDATSSLVSGWRFSSVMIVKLAGASIINSSEKIDDISVNIHPYGSSLCGLSEVETRHIELVQFLLASAEKIAYQQYDHALKLLNMCDKMSLSTGNPVQRIVYYFREALQERIDWETGQTVLKSSAQEKQDSFDVKEAMIISDSTSLSLYQQVPMAQVAEISAIQAIVENVALARKIHLIDFAIRSGAQWSLLMQALLAKSDFSLELLKITAIGTFAREKIEKIRKHLTGFAKTLNIPFSFNIVIVSDVKFLKESHFRGDDDEVVVVYAPIYSFTLISKPDSLESLMRMIKKLNPLIMVVNEVESNQNSPIFVNRFYEALFFYSAYFDCLEACMTHNNRAQMETEALYFREGIRNVVATDGQKE
ncbi:Transcription factor GRAS [Dillenia turbinata]|uniref:Transcription factor GRAS n=1 Tax=Dillenia turbinata TaxID=194707 RepID=A0AAN8UPH6_9MAGN